MNFNNAVTVLRMVNGLGVGCLAWHLLMPSPAIYLRNDVDGGALKNKDTSSKKATLMFVNAGRGPMYITKMELYQMGSKPSRWESLHLLGASTNYTVCSSANDLLASYPITPRLVTEASEFPLATFRCRKEDDGDSNWPSMVSYGLADSNAELRVTYKLADTGLLSRFVMTKNLPLIGGSARDMIENC
jgi:hypothetical protein